MTGPEHYKEAERLAHLALDADYLDEPARHRYALVAQVHATLAHAAATALGAQRVDDHGMYPVDANAWALVASDEEIGHG